MLCITYLMKKKKRYPRDEALYNLIQESEFEHFFEFVKYIGFKVCKTKKMRRVITCLLVWHKFPNLSARRAKSLLKLFRKVRLIGVEIPCFKTLCNYRENSMLVNVLDEIIEESSKPLNEIEQDFATDSTGIRTKLFSTWYSLRIKKRIRKRDHLTVHTSIGVKSKIITALNVEVKRGKDNIIFREHVDKTARNFKINEWSGDGVYWAKANCTKVVEKGGKPYFNCKKSWNGKQGGHPAWKEMNLESRGHPRRYKKHYHKRSNVETANQSKKMLHGDKVYSKYDSSRINEEYLRWVNHNQCVLNRARLQWGIIPKFMG